MGGVLVTINHAEAVRRFTALGIAQAAQLLDPYAQSGPFGLLEEGRLTPEAFVAEAGRLAGRALSWEECAYGWLGYAQDVPPRNGAMLERLRAAGYRLVLLSNMNPFINAWLEGAPLLPPTEAGGAWRGQPTPFDPANGGRPLSSYFDACYRSYEIQLMKPDPRVFRLILEREGIRPEETLLVDDGPRNCAAAAALGLQTLQPVNGEDWTAELSARLLATDAPHGG